MNKRRKLLAGIVVFGIAMALLFTSCSLFGDMDELRLKVAEKNDGDEPGADDVYDPGDGSVGNPFKVSNAAELAKVGSGTDGWTLDAHYIQTAKITLTDNSWVPIGTLKNPFTGIYNGNGKTINLGAQANSDNGILITEEDWEESGTDGDPIKLFGLFGMIMNGAKVKNLKLTGSITADPSYNSMAGSVASCNWGGEIYNISSKVNITCGYGGMAGGIVGVLTDGAVYNCYSSAIITAYYGARPAFTGGIVGYTNDSDTGFNCNVEKCYAEGRIKTGGDRCYAGGIVGANSMNTGVIMYCAALHTGIDADAGAEWGRIVGLDDSTSGGTLHNYANSGMVTLSPVTTNDPDDENGADVNLVTYQNETWWTATTDWGDVWGGETEAKPWKWNGTAKRPILWFE